MLTDAKEKYEAFILQDPQKPFFAKVYERLGKRLEEKQ